MVTLPTTGRTVEHRRSEHPIAEAERSRPSDPQTQMRPPGLPSRHPPPVLDYTRYYLGLFVDDHGQITTHISPTLLPLEEYLCGQAKQRLRQYLDMENERLLAAAAAAAAAARVGTHPVPRADSPGTDAGDAGDAIPNLKGEPADRVEARGGSISRVFGRPPKRRRAETAVARPPRGGDHIRRRSSRTAAGEQQQLLHIPVGDRPKMKAYFVHCFHAIQQINCRVVSKVWIKAIEPKKQVHHPYNGGKGKGDEPKDPERTKPDYWPPHIQHKEPDHIKKSERIPLLLHMLLLTGQGPLAHITAHELEEVTASVKHTFNHERAWEILQELFRSRINMERFEHGEIDGTTVISVIDRHSDPRKGRGARHTDEMLEDDDEDEAEGPEAPEAPEDGESPPLHLLTPNTSSLPSPVNPMQRDRGELVHLAPDHTGPHYLTMGPPYGGAYLDPSVHPPSPPPPPPPLVIKDDYAPSDPYSGAHAPGSKLSDLPDHPSPRVYMGSGDLYSSPGYDHMPGSLSSQPRPGIVVAAAHPEQSMNYWPSSVPAHLFRRPTVRVPTQPSLLGSAPRESDHIDMGLYSPGSHDEGPLASHGLPLDHHYADGFDINSSHYLPYRPSPDTPMQLVPHPGPLSGPGGEPLYPYPPSQSQGLH